MNFNFFEDPNENFIVYKTEAARMLSKDEKRLKKKKVSILFSEIGRSTFQEACSIITKWKVQEFRICKNSKRKGQQQHKQILRDLAQINLPFLTLINVRKNKIETIEKLHRIQMPLVKQLLIFENSITSIKDLRKAKWPSMTRLPIQNNYIYECYNLEKACSRQYKDLNIESLETKGQCCDVSWVVKLTSSELKYLRIKSNIKQKGLELVLRKKFSYLSIDC